jgi:lipoyl(octanoyl) transferase
MKSKMSFYDERSEIQVMDLGLLPYKEAWEIQKQLVQKRIEGECPDTLLFVEHPPVITLGRATQRSQGSQDGGDVDPSFMISSSGIELVAVERGGRATYHGPGQLVAYPIFQLARPKSSTRPYRSRSGVLGLIRSMEEGMIAFLKSEGLDALAIPEKTGVWVRGPQALRPPERKIASIGIAVKRWVSYHGLAFNYSTGLAPWRQLNPCGLGAEVMTDLSLETQKSWSRDVLRDRLGEYLLRSFERS